MAPTLGLVLGQAHGGWGVNKVQDQVSVSNDPAGEPRLTRKESPGMDDVMCPYVGPSDSAAEIHGRKAPGGWGEGRR